MMQGNKSSEKKDNSMDCEICFKFAEDKLQAMHVKGSAIAVISALSTLMQYLLLQCCNERKQALSELKKFEYLVMNKFDERKRAQNENS